MGGLWRTKLVAMQPRTMSQITPNSAQYRSWFSTSSPICGWLGCQACCLSNSLLLHKRIPTKNIPFILGSFCVTHFQFSLSYLCLEGRAKANMAMLYMQGMLGKMSIWHFNHCLWGGLCPYQNLLNGKLTK